MAGSEKLAEAEQVRDARLHLEAAGEPEADEESRVVGDGHQIIALHAEPDLGGRVRAVGHGDRGCAIGTDMGEEGNSQVSDRAAELAVSQEGLAVLRVHGGDLAGQFFERLTAFLSGCHETPRFPEGTSLSPGWPNLRGARDGARRTASPGPADGTPKRR